MPEELLSIKGGPRGHPQLGGAALPGSTGMPCQGSSTWVQECSAPVPMETSLTKVVPFQRYWLVASKQGPEKKMGSVDPGLENFLST